VSVVASVVVVFGFSVRLIVLLDLLRSIFIVIVPRKRSIIEYLTIHILKFFKTCRDMMDTQAVYV